MPSKPYGMICALAKACEIVEPRWTLLILNEIWSGYTRFSDIRRAVGNVSPGVLSKRLSELEKAGLVERIEAKLSAAAKSGAEVVLLVRSNVRRLVGELVRASLPKVAVLSYNEVVPAKAVETLGIVRMEQA